MWSALAVIRSCMAFIYLNHELSDHCLFPHPFTTSDPCSLITALVKKMVTLVMEDGLQYETILTTNQAA